ncbi:MAG: hypothetical protein JW832_18505 [Deltaproteobacteria bacterium]|nr:hypothetical protein [Deltaproteobacteria bacterium]
MGILAAFLLCTGSISIARADDGKNIFMTKCGSCHRAGGEASVCSPSKYAGVQWQRFFEKDRHTAKKNIKDLISPADLNAVQDYLVKHAADSEQPESLGVK